jgi:hypothetical protein
MISQIILKSLNSNLQITQENEILDLNEKSQIYGLTLNKEDVKEIINSRDNTLKSYGRIELDISITKMIIENLYKSQYTDKDDYVYVINDLHEVFYYLKNETLDQISDIEIIEIIDEIYNNCSGRIDIVQEKCEEFAKNYRWGIGGEI